MYAISDMRVLFGFTQMNMSFNHSIICADNNCGAGTCGTGDCVSPYTWTASTVNCVLETSKRPLSDCRWAAGEYEHNITCVIYKYSFFNAAITRWYDNVSVLLYTIEETQLKSLSID